MASKKDIVEALIMSALDDPILFAKYQIRRGWYGKWPTLESSKSEEEMKQQGNIAGIGKFSTILKPTSGKSLQPSEIRISG